MNADLQEINLRLLPGLDKEIDELLAIRAEMVQELRDQGVVVAGRRAVLVDDDEGGTLRLVPS